MSVFHGDRYDKDPEEFMTWFLQCTKTGDDTFKARNFINYIQAYSVADNWYEDLPQAEKKDWEAITTSFYKRWPRKQVIRTKEKATCENEPHSAPTPPKTITHTTENMNPISTTLALTNTTPTINVPFPMVPPSLSNDSARPVVTKDTNRDCQG